jgi:NAD(P)-dependent dehydrogenase (short-subunit alcohol dehydrogenase family)
VQRLFDEADQTIFGPVQVLIVNHGVWLNEDVPIVSMDLARWKGIMDINLTSSFLVVREFLKKLEARKARTGGTEIEGVQGFGEKIAVVFVGSTAGKYGEAGHAEYAVSKAGALSNDTIAAFPALIMYVRSVWKV